ncbi:heme/hemin ABC transporter substrate-binding protein [Congregibacter sp.]|uniref:heme/hemin ABC transporter substrate-binding protein n=1 Tax=Congregibacter sp. TaxID=2744308 RepID=UPI003F6B7898
MTRLTGKSSLPGVLFLVLLFAVATGFGAASAQERVISTDAAITELVLALGAGDRLVGVDVTSTLPAEYEDIKRVGYHRSLSAEGLLSLDPELLLVSEHAGPPAVIDSLASLGVRVHRLVTPVDPSQLRINIVAIADIMSVPEAALLNRVSDLSTRLTQGRLDAPGTLLMRERDGVLRVAGRGTAGDGLIALIGGDNVADYDGYRSYSQEALLSVNPELLLIAASREELEKGADSWLERYPLMQHLKAVSNHQFALVPAEALVGGVSITALEEASTLLQRFGTPQVAAP